MCKLCCVVALCCLSASLVLYYDEAVVLRPHYDDRDAVVPKRVVVSLSTFGPRLRYLKRSLPSILNQTRKPDRIIVSVPRVSRAGETNITEALQLTKEWPLVTLHVWDGVDPGPLTKLVGALELESDPDTYIITVDDDVEYGQHLVETLVARASDRAAVGFECVEPRGVFVAERHRHVSTGKWFLFPFDRAVVGCYGWLEGVQGIIYRRAFFDLPQLLSLQRRAPMGCWYDDDVFVAGYLQAKGIQRRIDPHYHRQMNAFARESTALIRHPQRDRWSSQCSNQLFGTHYDA